MYSWTMLISAERNGVSREGAILGDGVGVVVEGKVAFVVMELTG